MADCERSANAATAAANLEPQGLLRATVSSLSLSISPEAAQHALWAGALERQRQRLPRKYSAALQLKDYLSFSRTLEAHTVQFRGAKVTRCLERLSNSMQHLMLLTKLLENFEEGQANSGSIIWGAIEALTICALRYLSTLDKMITMLERLAETAACFNRYIHLLPSNHNLQKYLRLLYDEYVMFCLDAILFYQKKSYFVLISMFWNTLVEKFDATIAKINQYITSFEREARIAIDEEMLKGLKNLQPKVSGEGRDSAKIHEVPHSRNAFFLGRDIEIQQLHKIFCKPGGDGRETQKECLISGMGGMGKTQLALEYSYRYQKEYDWVFWVSCSKGAVVAQEFSKIGRQIRPANEVSSLDQVEDARRVLKILQLTRKKWLLIFDEAEDWKTLEPFWPHSQNGSIIVTSQLSTLAQIVGGHEILLRPLGVQDGAHLLLKHLKREAEFELPGQAAQDARNISRAFDGLPIALAHIATYIDHSGFSMREFMERYRHQENTWDLWSSSTYTSHQYHKSLDSIWDIALQELSSSATEAIRLMSMLSPSDISEDMLFNGWLSDEQRRWCVISIADRKLVSREASSEGPILSIHRALQLNISYKFDDDPGARQSTFNHAVELLRRVFPRQSEVQAPCSGNWEVKERFLPHVLSLQSVFEQKFEHPLDGTEEAAILFSDIGHYLWERVVHPQAMKSLELARKILLSCPVTDGLELSKVCSILGGLYCKELGEPGRHAGLELLIEALMLRKKHVETSQSSLTTSEYLLLANAWNDIACSLFNHGSYTEAKKYLERSLQIKTERGIPENAEAAFSYAENYKNLATVCIYEKDFKRGIELSARAVELIELNSSDSRFTSLFRFHYANSLFYEGQIAESFKIHENIRDQRLELFGPAGVPTLNSYYICSWLNFTMGRILEAEILIKECLARSNEWPQECVARAKYFFAQILRKSGIAHESTNELEAEALYIPKNRGFGAQDRAQATDLLVIFDHMVPFEAGRMTIGQLCIGPVVSAEDAAILFGT